MHHTGSGQFILAVHETPIGSIAIGTAVVHNRRNFISLLRVLLNFLNFCSNNTMLTGTLLFLSFLPLTALCQDDIGCYTPGVCTDSVTLTKVAASTLNDCLQECKDYMHSGPQDFECNYFTFYLDAQVYGIVFSFSKLSKDRGHSFFSLASSLTPVRPWTLLSVTIV